MAFEFSIIQFSNVNDANMIQGTVSDNTSTVGSFIGNVFSFSSAADVVAQTADGDFPDDGGTALTAPVTVNGITYNTGSTVEADWEFISVDPLTGYYYRVTGLYINNQPVGVSLSRAWDATTGQFVAGPAGIYNPGTALTHIDGDTLDGTPNITQFVTDSAYADYNPATGMGNDATLTASNGTVVCFTSGTLIKTRSGEVAVEALSVGDEVLTVDHGYQPIRWIGSRKLDAIDLRLKPNLRPIRIRAGALGKGMPRHDLLVSPQHRMLVSSKIAKNMFDEHEVLAAAKQLVLIDGIDVAEDVTEIEYWHFLFEDHEIVWANGALSESLYTGAEALKSVGPQAQEEIFAIFPHLRDYAPEDLPDGARLFLNGRQARKLAQRHAQKNRDVFEAH